MKRRFTEKYLEERFWADDFPSIQEFLDNTDYLETGQQAGIEAMKEWRRSVYNKLHQQRLHGTKKRIQTIYNKNEERRLKLRARKFNMKAVKYIKYASLNFPTNHTQTLCREDILTCKSLLLGCYNILKKLSRDPKALKKSGYDQIANEFLIMKDKFEALTSLESNEN